MDDASVILTSGGVTFAWVNGGIYWTEDAAAGTPLYTPIDNYGGSLGSLLQLCIVLIGAIAHACGWGVAASVMGVAFGFNDLGAISDVIGCLAGLRQGGEEDDFSWFY